ncbi:DNA-binding transcriptional LysR family regulator [Rhizobium sp. BK529]|uniref:LysR family transcriptional regulator n=1 Tax=unclassified Rhizobium TaxID=2613769 RepID=UPI00104C9CE8|nr:MULTISPECIES: LysR family transcriptional regulator [unclassified Rhizobium]MBB3590580.1 DNA-binding transcriptional LysR family regulator [Rhizobium sp. BK529]TCS05267.1 LysR family transcriptional regulator [Rhizobium sp. BK418]
MESLANLECFVRSAELGSFSGAARRLGLTPAAVSRNVAALEANLKIRLFYRSTRSLTLTEAGERFLLSVRDHLEGLQGAISGISSEQAEPAGVLKVSLPPTFGIGYILPLLPEFMARYPLVQPEWMFEGRPVDLIAEGYDAAVGGGFELAPGLVARALAPAHLVVVASPAYMRGRVPPADPAGLSAFDGIVMKSLRTGRMTQRQMRNAAGEERPVDLPARIVVNDPVAMRAAALLGLGVTLLVKADALPYLDSGELIRLVPSWYVDIGPISVYYANRTLLPLKTRVFVDFVVEAFQRQRWSERFAGSIG